jgi:hypothetical protein
MDCLKKAGCDRTMPFFAPTEQQSTTLATWRFEDRLKLDITPPRDHVYEPDTACSFTQT